MWVRDKNLVAVLQSPCASQNAELLLVSTFLQVDMLRADQLAPVRQAVEAFAAAEIDLDRIAAGVERLRLSA